MGQEGVHLSAHGTHFDAFVVGVVGVEADEVEAGDLHAVLVLEDAFIDVELETIVPIIRVGEVLEALCEGRLTEAVVKHDFFAAFPVVDFVGLGLRVVIDHVDGAADLVFLVEDGPFGAVGAQMGEIAAEVEELGEFDGEVLYWDGVSGSLYSSSSSLSKSLSSLIIFSLSFSNFLNLKLDVALIFVFLAGAVVGLASEASKLANFLFRTASDFKFVLRMLDS